MKASPLDNFSAQRIVVIADAVRWEFEGTASIPEPIDVEDRWLFE